MRPPSTIPVLLWRLARLYPVRALAITLGVVGILAVLAAGRSDRRAAAETCRFEQTWFQGDLHFSQELVFDPDGNGSWTTGGMASDAPHEHVDFQWHRDRSTLTAVSGGSTRTVGYEITQRRDLCFFHLDAGFLSHEGQSLFYSNSR